MYSTKVKTITIDETTIKFNPLNALERNKIISALLVKLAPSVGSILDKQSGMKFTTAGVMIATHIDIDYLDELNLKLAKGILDSNDERIESLDKLNDFFEYKNLEVSEVAYAIFEESLLPAFNKHPIVSGFKNQLSGLFTELVEEDEE